jgi:hypothetical protein
MDHLQLLESRMECETDYQPARLMIISMQLRLLALSNRYKTRRK